MANATRRRFIVERCRDVPVGTLKILINTQEKRKDALQEIEKMLARLFLMILMTVSLICYSEAHTYRQLDGAWVESSIENHANGEWDGAGDRHDRHPEPYPPAGIDTVGDPGTDFPPDPPKCETKKGTIHRVGLLNGDDTAIRKGDPGCPDVTPDSGGGENENQTQAVDNTEAAGGLPVETQPAVEEELSLIHI